MSDPNNEPQTKLRILRQKPLDDVVDDDNEGQDFFLDEEDEERHAFEQSKAIHNAISKR